MGLKQTIKRLVGSKFKYNCIECGKGHDGNIFSIEGQGYTNLSDFCSFDCFQKYVFKNGYSLKKKITDEKDKCVTCGKEHNNQFINIKHNYSTRSFCSRNCLAIAHQKLLPQIKNKKYRDNFKEMLELFKEGKSRKDLKAGKLHQLENLDVNYFFNDYKSK